MVDARDLALRALAEARERRLMETAARAENQPPPVAQYVGFDCKTGEALIRPLGGGIVRCQPLYNTAVKPGDLIDLHVSQGLPKGDNLSAFEPEPIVLTPEEPETFGKLIILFFTPDGGLWIGGDRVKPERLGTIDLTLPYDRARTWTIQKLNNKKNGYVVSGVGNTYLVPVPHILRYGARSSITLIDESTAQQGFLNSEMGISRIFGNGGWLIGAGRWEGYASVFPGLFPRVGANQTYAWAWIMSATTIGDGYIDTDVYIEDVSRTSSRVGSPAVVYYGQSVAVGGYSVNSIQRSRVIQNPFAWYQEFEESGTATGTIRIGGGIALTYDHSFSVPLYNDGGYPPNTQILASFDTTAPIVSFVNTTDSSCIYSEFRQAVVDNITTLPPTTKNWLQTGSTRIELTTAPAASARSTMVGTTLYDPRNLNTAASTFTLRTLTAPTTAGAYSQTETPATFHPIPTEATILDWSYHP